MAIPPRHIAHAVARHAMGAVDHILVDLVHRMANVQVAIGIRGAIMQRKNWPPFCLLLQPRIQPGFFPLFQPLRFLLWQAPAHGERGTGQEHRITIQIGGGLGVLVAAGCGHERVMSLQFGFMVWPCMCWSNHLAFRLLSKRTSAGSSMNGHIAAANYILPYLPALLQGVICPPVRRLEPCGPAAHPARSGP